MELWIKKKRIHNEHLSIYLLINVNNLYASDAPTLSLFPLYFTLDLDKNNFHIDEKEQVIFFIVYLWFFHYSI